MLALPGGSFYLAASLAPRVATKMNIVTTLVTILSQIFWGVTVGALGAAFSAIGKWLGAGLLLGGGMWWARRRQKARSKTSRQ